MILLKRRPSELFSPGSMKGGTRMMRTRWFRVYAEDIDHMNVFGEWQKGRATLRQELARLHAGPLRDSRKNHTIEKIRFLKPDVAIVQVSAQGTGGPNLGTYVMEKQKEGWVTVSFTNVAPHDPPWKK